MLVAINELNPVERQHWLQYAIAPRPIALASTMDPAGQVNLAPFSFFNLFSTTPPIVIFSPVRRVRNNTSKHSLDNLQELPELVINIVDYDMVQQTSLASCEYPKETNEFIKAGFTPVQASIVKPPMVKESRVKMECRVQQIIPLGNTGGSGNLVICEVLLMHVDESILNDAGTMIDQTRLHHVARLGGNWYCRTDADNLFEVEKPNVQLGIGFDQLPESIRHSSILTGNDLARLANVEQLPSIDPSFEDAHLRQIIQYYSVNPEEMEKEMHIYARRLIAMNQVREAWQVLLSA